MLFNLKIMLYRIVVLTFILFFSCKKEKNNENDANTPTSIIESKKINVTIDTIINKTFNHQIIVNGKVLAFQKTDLRFKTSENLVSIKVVNGQKVANGQLLASLENSLLKNKILKAEIDLQKAQNKFAEEKINYGKDNLTKQVLKVLKIKSGVLEARNSLERTQIEYIQTLLKAPFSGVIANLEKKQRDFITSSEVFCTVINPNSLEVSFSVIENEFSLVAKNQKIEIQSFVNKDQKFKGVITEINPLIDKNGLIKIKAKITSNNIGLLDGMNVKIFINRPLKNVISIPKKALVLRSNKEVVFTVENGLAKWNYVEIIGENNSSYAIKKGLEATDTIIVSGNLNLSHDAKVNTSFN